MRTFWVVGCILLTLQGGALAQDRNTGNPAVKLKPLEHPPSKFRQPKPYAIPQGNTANEIDLRRAIESDDSSSAKSTQEQGAGKRNASAVPPLNRSYQDNPDSTTEPMIHFIYAVPANGVDYGRDLTTLVPYAINSANRWLASQIRRKFRIDTYEGHLDITFVRLPNTEEFYESAGGFKLSQIETDMASALAQQPNKKYIVLYEGGDSRTCGEGFVGGATAAVYLRGLENLGSASCFSQPWASSPVDPPGYHEFVVLHEIAHTLGAVSAGAPNYVPLAHVGDTPEDLMYTGLAPWSPAIVDYGRNDYYNPRGLPGELVNLAFSPYLTKR
jgi:hypothetical protein